MKVILAQPRGFCAGVVRAIEIVERALQKYGPPVYVRHEIVHNKHVVESLKAKGARFVEDLSEVPPNAVTIFSAHGVAKSVEEEAAARNLPVLNATCPLVTKVHNQGKRYVGQGRRLILIGHAGHPEVEGTMGQICRAGDAGADRERRHQARYPAGHAGRLCHADHAQRRRHARHHRAPCTAASPTSSGRRRATSVTRRRTGRRRCVNFRKLVDVILVVGAKNSSNSNRLREIGEEAGTPSYLIADGSELNADWFRDAETVGITAGASAPEVLVEDVIDALRRLGPVNVSQLTGRHETIEFRLPPELIDGTPAARVAAKV